jgi:hypothetical protein
MLSSVLETAPSAFPHSASRFQVVFEKPDLVNCYDPIKKIWSSFESFKNSADTSIRRVLWSSLKIFRTTFAHAFLIFKSRVRNWWSVQSLILSYSAIIRIVKLRSRRMKCSTRLREGTIRRKEMNPACLEMFHTT